MDSVIVCLHENLHLIDQCADLLNREWPRSKTARLRSLQPGPPDSLPISLLMIKKDNHGESVVGHSKLLPMPQDKEACFVASVIIQNELRGKGLGRLLMEGTEDFARKRGMKYIYLSTHDKQEFYGRLGYELYDYNPVVLFGGSGMIDLCKLFANEDNVGAGTGRSDGNGNIGNSSSPTSSTTSTNLSKYFEKKLNPPPPPPLPKNSVTILSNASHSELKVHMKKVLEFK